MAPLTTHQPVPAPLQVIPPAPRPAAPPGAANFNYRVEVQVTDRLDAKVIAQETFTALVSLSNTTKVSRTTPAARAALEVMVLPVTPGPVSQYPAPTDPVKVKLVAQFNLAKGSANEKDPGVDIGQEVVTVVAPGKPATMVDLSSGPGRRFVVQVTLTRVPVE